MFWWGVLIGGGLGIFVGAVGILLLTTQQIRREIRHLNPTGQQETRAWANLWNNTWHLIH